MPNESYLITDGIKAIPLSALPAEAWSPVDPLDAGGSETSARRLRAAVPVLSRCLDVRAKGVASVPMRLERGGDDIADTPEGRAILATLRALMYRSEVGLCMSAAAYWELGTNRLGRRLTPFWCATGSVTETRDPDTGDPTFYRTGVRSGRALGVIDPRRIAPIYLPSDEVDIGPDPQVAPVRPALASAGLLRGLDAYSSAFFARGGVKITLLQLDSSLPKTERDKLKDWWDRAIRGVRSAFSSLVISNKVEPKVIGSDPKDTAAPELQKAGREDVAAAMGVPMSMLYSSALAGGTADAERLNFFEQTIFPESDLIIPVANERWLAPQGMEIIADYDRHEVRQWAFAQRAEAMVKLTAGAATLTVDEGRARLGLPPMEKPPTPPPPAAPAALPGPPGAPPQLPPPSDAPPDALPSDAPATKALALWQAKALNRLRRGRAAAVGFDDEALDPEEAAIIAERLRGATTPEAIKKAFAVPPPGSDLSEAERAVYDALRPVLERYGPKAAEALLRGEGLDTSAFSAELRAALASALLPLVASGAMDLAAGVGPAMDAAFAAGLSASYAEALGQRIAGITDTTLKAVQKAQALYRTTPGMTRGQLEQLLQSSFSPRRAESIAITETSNAAAVAATYTQRYLAEHGLTFVRRWNASNDERMCPICGPLNGKTEEVWKDRFPDGPAAHVRCRCWLTLAPTEEG